MPLKLYRRKGSNVWNFQGTVGPDGKRERLRGSCRTTDKAVAARQVAEIEQRYWKGHFDGPEAILTFGEAARMYRAVGKSTRFLDPVEDYLRHTLVKDITAGMIRQMAMDLFGKCSGTSRNRMAIVPAQAVINYAAASKLCQTIRVERFEVETKEKGFATLEWVQAFQKHASPQLGAFALFMFLTGARPTEALEAEIDIPGATALLRESKIGHERRAHLPAMLVAALANLPEIPGRPLFFYRVRDCTRPAWNAAIERAGIQRLTPHCCRHGFITGLLRRGVDVKTVSWLGDVSPATLLKTYAHAIKDRRLTDVLTDTLLTQPINEGAGNPRKTGTT
jgi:integrase